MNKKQTPNGSSMVSFGVPMDAEGRDCDGEEEEIDEAFICCICLDLLYKPIVLACGHIACFWCVHRAMNNLQESHCPICRCPYNHFPSICHLLHFLLLKMYPVAYRRREKQVLEVEQENDIFSPQFDDPLIRYEELNQFDGCAHISADSQIKLLTDSCSTWKMNSSAIEESSEYDGSFHEGATAIPKKDSAGNFEATKNLAVEQNRNDLNDRICKQISVTDVMCAKCKQLLFQPAVLNCGHVYCESCIATNVDDTLKCQICQSLHPKGCPKVCLELHNILEKQFSVEYALRREAVQHKQVLCRSGNPSIGTMQDGKQGSRMLLSTIRDSLSWFTEHEPKVHFGVGCDSCGVIPIVGERYRCKDCVERIGFDLCGDCYNTSSKRPGRFNQQHTPDHKFALVKLRFRFVVERDGDTSVQLVSYDASEDQQDDSHVPTDKQSDDGSTVQFVSYDALENQQDASHVPTDDAAEGREDATPVPMGESR